MAVIVTFVRFSKKLEKTKTKQINLVIQANVRRVRM